ncbi:MAG: copper chaperone PCu(A)C [Intrasporangiaceae bacterium]|nr:copper chaperone PCu(A)C [Intrasporangiaceae bacterium]
MTPSCPRAAIATIAVLLLLVVLSACGPSGTPDLSVSTAQAAVPVAGSSQIVVAITNDGDGDDELVEATTPAALGVELHVTEIEDGRATMQDLDTVRLPAGETTRLRPGGLHLMMVVPDETVVEGGTFDLTLHFDRSDEVTVPVEVVPLLDLAEKSFDQDSFDQDALDED